GRADQRLPDRRARRRPGPAVPEGQPRVASASVRPAPGSAGVRSRAGLGSKRATGADGGGETGGDAARGPGLTATEQSGEAAVGPAGVSVAGGNRRANQRLAAGFRAEAVSRPRREGAGSVGRLGDRDPQPGEDRGSRSK